MPVAIEPEVEAFIKKLPVARLATADAEGRPSVVPVCFVLVDGYFYTPIDEKRKSVSWGRLKRLRNIESNPSVSLVIDHYELDWTALGYVLVRGVAETIAPRGRYAKEHAGVIARLRSRYPQYKNARIDQKPLIKISPESITLWTATE
ncbi:MAG: TIGR03668 family PPOX class F420-dependent oxidoreductase [Acidobacteriota bacterium]|nr:MAG: TIGR03668 family PPOX class F420-dependent oxidoreductase [Acidobacteriota bacterium]